MFEFFLFLLHYFFLFHLKSLTLNDYEKNINEGGSYNYSQPYNNNEIMIIKGYDFSFELSNFNAIDDKETVKIDNKTYALKSEDKDYGFDLSINNEVIPIKIYDFIKSNSAFENNDNSINCS